MGVSSSVNKNPYEVPEGKSANEYKALARKFANKCKEIRTAANKELDGITVLNYKSRADNVRRIVNKEPFEQAGMLVGGSDYDLMKKNEQICTLIVIVIVLITAFILLGCYMCMRGGMISSRTNGGAIDNVYRP